MQHEDPRDLVARVRKRLRAFEEAQVRRRVWRMVTGWKPWTGRVRCLRLLGNPRHRCRNCGPEAHPDYYGEDLARWELWRTPDGRFAVIAHPRRVRAEVLDGIAERFGAVGVWGEGFAGEESSWTWGEPGQTGFVILLGQARR